MTEDIEEIFVVVAEFHNQAPIIMETEGEHTSREAAYERIQKLKPLRACIARLTYETGNGLLIHDLKRMQK